MSNTRTEQIKTLLQQCFSPQYLTVTDDSHLHAGHAQAGGAGHFRVQIVATDFVGLSRLQRHQVVFAALSTLMKTQIHALSIEAKTPQEWKNAE